MGLDAAWSNTCFTKYLPRLFIEVERYIFIRLPETQTFLSVPLCGRIDGQSLYVHYLWVYLPASMMFAIRCLFTSIEFGTRILQP